MADVEVRITAVETSDAVRVHVSIDPATEEETHEPYLHMEVTSEGGQLRSALVSEVILKVYEGFDETTCPSCHNFIGWGIGPDDYYGRGPSGVFASFWVVEHSGKAWPLCEDCVGPVLDPIDFPSDEPEPTEVLHTGEGPTHRHGPAEHAHSCEAGDAHYHLTPNFPYDNAVYPEESDG